MYLPPSSIHVAGIMTCSDLHTPINDGNAVPICDSVQYVASDGTVHATHQDVAVLGLRISLPGLERNGEILDSHRPSRAPLAHCAFRDVGLEPAHIPRTGIEQTVQIVILNRIVINQHNVSNADPCQSFGYDAPDAAKSDDTYPHRLNASLLGFSPALDRPPLSVAPSPVANRLLPHHESASFHYSYFPAYQTTSFRGVALPNASTPVSVGADGHPDQRPAGRSGDVGDPISLGPDVDVTHALPSCGRMAVHEYQTLRTLYSLPCRPRQITTTETDVPGRFEGSVPRLGQDNVCYDGSLPFHPATRRPETEA